MIPAFGVSQQSRLQLQWERNKKNYTNSEGFLTSSRGWLSRSDDGSLLQKRHYMEEFFLFMVMNGGFGGVLLDSLSK